MKKFAATSFMVFALCASASAQAEATFHINAPTKEDTIIHSRESVWAKEDKNPAIDFFAQLFGQKSKTETATAEPVVETKTAEVKAPEQQHVASVELSDK